MDTNLLSSLKSQYHASLAMLREAIVLMTDELWYSTAYTTTCWQLGYHTVFFAHLYSQKSEADFIPWRAQDSNVQHPDAIPGPADANSPLPLIAKPYSREQVLRYLDECIQSLDEWLNQLDLESNDSGFSWYKISKLEHQLVNIRHIQHGAAQLADRLRSNQDVGVKWIGADKR